MIPDDFECCVDYHYHQNNSIGSARGGSMHSLSILAGTGMKDLFTNPLLKGSPYTFQKAQNAEVDTPYGSVPVTSLLLNDKDGSEHRLRFIHRHHGVVTTPPHNIDYRANIHAATSLDVNTVLTIHSVGSLVSGFPPGSLGMACDMMDFSGIVSTFHDDDAVHVDVSRHFSHPLGEVVRSILQQAQPEVEVAQVVAQMTGPQFETRAEVEVLFRLGATAVGMTLSPEAKLLAELQIRQVALLASSNWASGRNPAGPDAQIAHHRVEDEAERTHGLIWDCILALLDAQIP